MAGSKKKFYYNVAKVLHWLAGFIIAFNLLSGWRLGGFELEHRVILIMVHSGIGVTIFGLMLLRWWWRRRHNLYTPPRWWKRPSMLMQWIFYPLLLIQPLLGVALASVIDYEVRAFGFINFSALAADNKALEQLAFQLHGGLALFLIGLVLVHGIERSRKAFAND